MPSAYTATQKKAIADFVLFTSAKESTAVKVSTVEAVGSPSDLPGQQTADDEQALKATGWNLEQAVDAHFSKRGAQKPPPQALHKIFDEFRDTPENPDVIGTDGTVKYLSEIGVALDEVAMLAVLTQVAAPTMGELTRAGFVNGWDSINANTITEQRKAADGMRKLLSSDQDLFKSTYRHAFNLAKQAGQKAVMLETAEEFWKMLFGSAGVSWQGEGVDWLGLYVGFLDEKWKKSVSRDLWNQTLEFARKTMEDGSLSWYSEEGSWPAVIDEFVTWAKANAALPAGEKMETD